MFIVVFFVDREEEHRKGCCVLAVQTGPFIGHEHVFVLPFQHEISDTRQSVSAVSRSKCVISMLVFRRNLILNWMRVKSRCESPCNMRGREVLTNRI